MALLDLLGRRWMLRVLWELRDGALSFRALRERCDGLSPSVLNARLRETREAGLVELRADEGYALTADGATLLASLGPLYAWASRWGAARGRTKPLSPCAAAGGAASRPRAARRPRRCP
jgi:DNA-binding HxlR family transcriptional regulator